MASTFVNDLRLEEIGSGEQSGSWGDTTNTNLELIAEAFSFGTEAITTNADTHTTTIADGATDPGRSMFLKYTGTLDSACTITIAPNTVSKLWFIENGTSGSQNILISQGSGANVTIPAGQTKAIYSNGGGSGAAMVDAFATLNVVDLLVDDDLTVTDDLIVGGDIDLEGSIDVNGTANLDAVDIDGAVQIDNTVSVGVDDTGYDVKFFGDTASAFMLWDASADDLILGGAAGLSVNSAALVTGVLTTTAATVFNGGFASNANSTVGGTLITTGNMSISETGADNEKSITIANSSVAGGMIGVEGSSGNRFSGSAVNNMFIGTTTADGLEFATNNVVRANIASDGSASFNGTLTIPSQLIHAGDTDTLFEFQGANSMRFKAGGNEVVEMDGNTVTFNDGSADYDFRVESNGNANMLFVDGGNDAVGIGTTPSGSEILHVLDSAHGTMAKFECTESGAVHGPTIEFQRDSSSPADNDLIGRLNFTGNDSGGNTTIYTQISNLMRDVTDGTEDGLMEFGTIVAGTLQSRLELDSTEAVFNEGSIEIDFRVESDDTTHMLFVDAGSNLVIVGGGTNTSGGAKFKVAEASQNCELSINATASVSDIVSYNRNSGAYHPLAVYGSNITFIPTTGSSVVVNEGGTTADFRVESQSHSDMFNVDGGGNVVAIGKTSSTGGADTEGAYFAHAASQHFHLVITNESTNTGHAALYINRQSVDNSTLVNFMQAGSIEGSITVNGSTVSYNGFSGRHESSGIPLDTPLGTVVSTIDELDVYPDRTTGVEGNAIDHLKAGQTRADHAKVEVSNSVGDSCVYGYVSDFDGDGKLIVTSVGIGSIRVTGACSKGDLLESNGDGTAKVQSDDIVRSKTIGKVTIGNSNTGVKLVSCVMYCG